MLRVFASRHLARSSSHMGVLVGTTALLWAHLLQPIPVACNRANAVLQPRSRNVQCGFGRIAPVFHCALEYDPLRAHRAAIFTAAKQIPSRLTAWRNERWQVG